MSRRRRAGPRRALRAIGLGAITSGLIGLATGIATGQAPPAPPGLKLGPIASFDHPTYVTQAPGEPRTLYVTEQPGRVVAVRQGAKIARPFLDISERVHFGPKETPSVEAGLFSIAFDPNYPVSGRFYVFYTGPGGANYIDSYKRAAGKAVRTNRGSRRLVLKVPHPYADTHNGGQLQFGPDGLLWISTGDGGCCGDSYDQARSLGTLLGKLLRINPRARQSGFRVPPTNPLVATPGPDAIYSWGLRNAWRFSFDRLTGHLVIADVGDNEKAREEINYLHPDAARGGNFGWPQYEGFRLRDSERAGPGPPIAPIQAYSHRGPRCAITGGYVVRDPALPQLYGRYLYADYCGGRVRSLAPPTLGDGLLAAPGRVGDDRDEGLHLRYPSSFGEGLGGQIYVVSHAGRVFRLRSRR